MHVIELYVARGLLDPRAAFHIRCLDPSLSSVMSRVRIDQAGIADKQTNKRGEETRKLIKRLEQAYVTYLSHLGASI